MYCIVCGKDEKDCRCHGFSSNDKFNMGYYGTGYSAEPQLVNDYWFNLGRQQREKDGKIDRDNPLWKL